MEEQPEPRPGRGSRGYTHHLHLWITPELAAHVADYAHRTNQPTMADAWRAYLDAGHHALTEEQA